MLKALAWVGAILAIVIAQTFLGYVLFFRLGLLPAFEILGLAYTVLLVIAGTIASLGRRSSRDGGS